jgi:hypothetical protein
MASPGESNNRSNRASFGLTLYTAIYLVVVGVGASWLLVLVFPESKFDGVSAPTTVVAIEKPAPAGSVVPAPSASSAVIPASREPTPREPPVEIVAPSPVQRWHFEPVRFGKTTVFPRLTTDRGLILLALLAGLMGGFVHATESFIMFVGNREFVASWHVFYVLRPLVGAVLGVLFYFVVRAGLLSANADSVSPYGVVAFGALAGWFSKRATEKLKEVFETLFRTQENPAKDPLGATVRPKITKLTPEFLDLATLSAGDQALTIDGEGFVDGAMVIIANLKVKATFSPNTLDCFIPRSVIPAKAGDIEIMVEIPLPNKGAPPTQWQRSEPKLLPVK